MTKAITLALDSIETNELYQPRIKGISEQHVRLLMKGDPEDWAPIIVSAIADVDDRYTVTDGFHRVEASRRLGLSTIRAVVQDNAGYPEAFAANIAHGLPLSLQDRKAYARWLTDDEPDLSLREVGRRCGLSHNTVKAALEEPERESSAGQNDQPNPLVKLVRLVEKSVTESAGVNALKFWEDRQEQRTAAVLRILNERQTDKKTIAGVKALGAALVAAAGQYKG
jgi:ParB-like chromosome segregation protein Spo0J